MLHLIADKGNECRLEVFAAVGSHVSVGSAWSGLAWFPELNPVTSQLQNSSFPWEQPGLMFTLSLNADTQLRVCVCVCCFLLPDRSGGPVGHDWTFSFVHLCLASRPRSKQNAHTHTWLEENHFAMKQ